MSDKTWSIQKIRSTMNHRFGPPQPPPNHTIVVFHRGICLGPMGPHIQLKLNDCRQGFYEFWVMSTGSHKMAPLHEKLETNETGVYFAVTVEIQYHVNNPDYVARNHEATLPEDIVRELRRMLQQHARRYGPLEKQEVKQDLEMDLMRRRQLAIGVELINPKVDVSIDSKVESVYRDAFDIRTQEIIRDAEAERDIRDFGRQSQVNRARTNRDLLQEDNTDMLFQRRMDRYTRVLSQGKIEQFAALLAEPDNSNLREIVQYFENQRENVVAERWKLFLEVIKSDDTGLLAARIKEAMKALGIDEHPQIPDKQESNRAKNRPLLDNEDEDQDYSWTK